MMEAEVFLRKNTGIPVYRLKKVKQRISVYSNKELLKLGKFLGPGNLIGLLIGDKLHMIDHYDRYKDYQMEYVADHHDKEFKCIVGAKGLTKGKVYKGKLTKGTYRSRISKSFFRVEVLNDFRLLETYDTGVFKEVKND